jgi:hypothetical protein
VKLLGAVVVGLFLLGGLGMVAGGVYNVVVRETGEHARARVTECHKSGGRYRSDVCSGKWIAGGSLLDGGHVVLGTIDGASSGDLGQTIDVRLSGDRAYTTSLRVPIILIVLGLGIAFVGVRLLLVRRRPMSGERAG